MNIMPLVGFYWKHGSQINALASKTGTDGSSSLVLDVVTALAPVVKKHWPQLNDNNLVDDGVQTLRDVMAPAEQPAGGASAPHSGGPHG